jgi:hypothetical protein
MAAYTRLTNLEVEKDCKAETFTGALNGNVTGIAVKAHDAVPTATGATTGTIPAGVNHVNVTSGDANHIIILPAPVIGQVITLINGATGYALRSSDPAAIGINGGTAENAESEVAANTVVVVRCVSETNWIGQTFTAAGVVGVLQVAAA